MAQPRISPNLIQNLPARAARENLEKSACYAYRRRVKSSTADSESHPASTPPAHPCWLLLLLRVLVARARAEIVIARDELPPSPTHRTPPRRTALGLAAPPHRIRARALGLFSLAMSCLPTRTPARPATDRPPPAHTARAHSVPKRETGGRAKFAQNLPGWIKICLTKICLRFIQNPDLPQARPRRSSHGASVSSLATSRRPALCTQADVS